MLFTVKGLSLERLRAFLEVAEAGGIARAAPGAPVRQSQLSRQISQLETALSQAVFHRAGRRLILTPAGAQLVGVVRELSKGLTDVASTSGPVGVSLGGGDSVLRWVLLPAVGRLRQDFGDVLLDVRALGAAQVVQGLGDHSLDLGLLRGSEPTGELKTLRLGRIDYALFVARERRGSRDWRALLEEVPLAIATSEPGLLEAVAALGPAKLRCETFPQVAQAVRAGFAGVLPTFARQELPAAEFRQLSPPSLEAAGATLLLAWRRRLDELRPRVKAVRRGVEKVVRAGLGGA